MRNSDGVVAVLECKAKYNSHSQVHGT